jgi:hypothetical protein
MRKKCNARSVEGIARRNFNQAAAADNAQRQRNMSACLCCCPHGMQSIADRPIRRDSKGDFADDR